MEGARSKIGTCAPEPVSICLTSVWTNVLTNQEPPRQQSYITTGTMSTTDSTEEEPQAESEFSASQREWIGRLIAERIAGVSSPAASSSTASATAAPTVPSSTPTATPGSISEYTVAYTRTHKGIRGMTAWGVH